MNLKKALVFTLLFALLGSSCNADTPSYEYQSPSYDDVRQERSINDVLDNVEEDSYFDNSLSNPSYDDAPRGYYENTSGNLVPRPYTAPSKPAGATAKCRDGTYSFSQSRRGTCSHHGGVSGWY